MRESAIEKHLVKRVEELGGEVRKVKWIGRRGAPDRLVMLPAYRGPKLRPDERVTAEEVRSALEAVYRTDQTIWVELKAPGEAPEPHQAREHERMRRMGQRVEVIDSIEGVEEILK